MLLLILSLLPLLFGPLLVLGLQRVPAVIPALDGFVLAGVGGIALLHVLPDCVAHGGWLALVAGVAGLLLPFVRELFDDHHDHEGKHRGLVILGLAGLALHGLLDGVALAAGALAAAQGILLSLGVLIHRVPSGVAIWWLARRRLGLRGALISVFTLAAASVMGFAASHRWQGIFHGAAWYVVQALLFGALLHVLLHAPLTTTPDRRRPTWRLSTAAGAVVGSAMLILLSHLGSHEHAGVADMLQQVVPNLLLGLSLLVAVIELIRLRRR